MIKLLIITILLVVFNSMNAQVYLDYAKIHRDLKPMGGYNISQLTNGDYYVVDNYTSYQTDVDPDEDNVVQVYTSYLSAGLYFAKYNKKGEYIKHTFLRGGASASHAVAFATNDSFVAIMGQFYDSVWLYNPIGGKTLKMPRMNTYIAKYTHNLELVESIALANDSGYFDKIKFTSNGDLLILGYNKGDLNIDIKGTSVKIEAKQETRIPNTNDIFLLKLDKHFNYIKHTHFGIRGTEVMNQMEFDNNGQLYLSGYASFRGNSVILGDSIPMSAQFGYGTSPLILKFNSNLDLIDYHINNLKTSAMIIRHPNGDILMSCLGALTSQIDGYYYVLLDSNLNEKIRTYANGYASGNFAMGENVGFITKDNNYGMIATTNGANLLILDKDSLKMVSVQFLNKAIKTVFHADTNNILATIQFNGEISLQNSAENGPPFMIGDRLNPTQENTAVINYSYDCTPVTAYLQNDTQSNCADEYGMYTGTGNVRLIYEGSGAAFQWYNASDTTFKLSDQASPLQGGQSWRGTKSSYLKYQTGTNKFILSEYRAKIGGSCTSPFFSDTATQIIWGAPRMVGKVANLIADEGSNDSIEAYMQDLNYPLDSIEFQWYRGATALIEGFHFLGTTTQKLFIKNIKPNDEGIYSCVALRVHCKNVNSALSSSTFLKVNSNNPSGINTVDFKNISVYPNPVSDLLNIHVDTEIRIQKYEVYDALGRKQLEGNNDIKNIDVSTLKQGIFVLKIIVENQVYTTQFIKN